MSIKGQSPDDSRYLWNSAKITCEDLTGPLSTPPPPYCEVVRQHIIVPTEIRAEFVETYNTCGIWALEVVCFGAAAIIITSLVWILLSTSPGASVDRSTSLPQSLKLISGQQLDH